MTGHCRHWVALSLLALAGCAQTPQAPPPGPAAPAARDAQPGALQRTRDLAPKAYAAYAVGLHAFAAEDWAKAAAHFELVLALDPQARNAYRYVLRCYDALKVPDAAMPVLDKGAAQFPDDFHVHAETGSFLDRWLRPGQAIEAYERARRCSVSAKDGPACYAMLDRLANMYLERGQLAEALSCLEQVRTIGAAPQTAVDYRIGQAYCRAGQYAQAIPHMERVRQRKADFAPAWRYLAVCYDETQAYEKAVHAAKRYIKLAPDKDWLIHSLLADLYEKTFQTGKARQEREHVRDILAKRVEAGSSNPTDYFQLARTLRIERDYDEALAVLGKALPVIEKAKTEGLVVSYHYALAEVYYGKDDGPQLEKHLRKVLELDPNRHDASNLLGYYYAERGIHLAEAERLVLQALKHDPQNGAYLDSLGWVYYQQAGVESDASKLHKALGKLLEATQRLRDPVIYDHAGDVQHALGRWDEAQRLWETALSMWRDRPHVPPGPEAVKHKLERLRKQKEMIESKPQ